MFMGNRERYTNCTFKELITQREWHTLHIISITDCTGSSTNRAFTQSLPQSKKQNANWNIWSHSDTDLNVNRADHTDDKTNCIFTWLMTGEDLVPYDWYESFRMYLQYVLLKTIHAGGIILESAVCVVWSVIPVALKQYILS